MFCGKDKANGHSQFCKTVMKCETKLAIKLTLHFIQPGWKLNFCAPFMENVSIIWIEKDKIVK
jgi:hypothetical protein